MASNFLNMLQNLRQNLHNVGSLSDWNKSVLNQGAIAAGGNFDNFTLVTLGFNQKGERIATALADSAVKGHLVATPEDYLEQYETISSFFNEEGERVRVVRLEEGVRFECSNFDLEDPDTNANPIKNGALVHYNHADHKFVISNATALGAPGYAGAGNQLVVVDCNCATIDGREVIRFEVTK